MAYYVSSTNTVYIQGNGFILANSDSSYLFANFTKLQTIEGLQYLDTSEVTSMLSMFDQCSKLASLDLSKWVTSNVTNMRYMFQGCKNLTSLNLSKWDTSHVTDMSNMFYDCSNLASIEGLSDWDTSSVTDMNYMFKNCSKLSTTITIRNSSMSIYYSYYDMFYNAALTSNNAKIVVNYIYATSSLVDKMIATASSGSNVVRGDLVG